MEKVTLNKEQKLFVIPSGGGYSCYGFTVLNDKVKKLIKEMGLDMKLAKKGTLKQYDQYLQIAEIARKRNAQTGWRSQVELIPEFIGKEGYRVEVVDKYGEKRRFIIGKSTGYIPCHIEILKSNSYGGIAVTGYPFKSVKFLELVRGL